MLTDQLLQTIQAERERQIREADRVRMLTPVDTDPEEARALPANGPERLRGLEGRSTCHQVRPATDTSA